LDLRRAGKVGQSACKSAWQTRRKPLHRDQGVPALVCRRAFARSKENMAVGTLFLLDFLRDFSERSRSRSRAFRGASWTSGGFRKCVLSKTAGAGSRLKDDRLHRWGRPFWGLRAPRPVRTATSGCGLLRRPEGRMSAAPSCLRFVQRQARTAGRNRRFPDVKPGRQAERVSGGSSG
jgi:hypothetical protein